MKRQTFVSALGASVFLLSLWCCAGADRSAARAGAPARDSAGITIVDYGESSPKPSEWHLEQVGALRADTGDSVPLYRIRGLVTFPSGRTAVANGGSSEILWFDRNDRLIRASGREGEGPGEFRDLVGIHRLYPDSLLAYDAQLMRYQVFDSAGRFVREFHLGRPGEAPSNPEVLATTDQGGLIVRSLRSYDNAPQGVSRLGFDIRLYDRDGHYVAPVTSAAGWEVYKPASVNRVMFEPMAIPWGHNTELAATPRAVILADNYTGEIKKLGLKGVLERIFRPPPTNRAHVTNHEKEAAKQKLLANAPPPAAAMFRAAYADMPLPSQKSLIEDICATEDGGLWLIETSTMDSAPRRAVVLDPDLRIAGTLSLPNQLGIRVITHDYILGIWTDELGVEQVRRFRIVR